MAALLAANGEVSTAASHSLAKVLALLSQELQDTLTLVISPESYVETGAFLPMSLNCVCRKQRAGTWIAPRGVLLAHSRQDP